MYYIVVNIIRVQQLAYVAYIHMPIFIGIHMIWDMHTMTCTVIFSLCLFEGFKKFSGSYNFILFKNLLLYNRPLIYLFALRRNKFFTVYICFKETLFLNFSYKLFHKYFSLPLNNLGRK